MNIDDINSAPKFSLDGYIATGKVCSVYDGDSMKIIFPFYNNFYTWTCRLKGVDTPEIRTKNIEEKEKAIIVRDKVREKIMNKKVTVHCGKFDKYGRLLIDIICVDDKCHINQWLLENKLAVEYYGGKKNKTS